MAIKFLNISAEEAVLALNRLIVEGYEIKVDLDTEYSQTKKEKGGIDNSSVHELISKWEVRANDWFGRALKILDEVYTSKRHMYEFREAKERGISVQSSTDSTAWVNLSRSMGAKLEKLNEFDDFIKREFRIEYVAGDKVEGNKYQQIGNESIQEVHK